eukprot:m.793983 g.793983  ORF g.793983 m.793983 type:complete len:297 (+) comp23338_c0_seq24:613-1503(+)
MTCRDSAARTVRTILGALAGTCDVTKAGCCVLQCHHYSSATCGLSLRCVMRIDRTAPYFSQGHHLLVEDWFEFVATAEEFHDEFVIPTVSAWNKETGDSSVPLKVFGHGESMGGGVLCSMLIRRQTQTVYDGAVFVSPMLEVSADMRPHPIIEFIFRHVLVPLMPTWPITPSEDLTKWCFTDPDVVAMCELNPFGLGVSKPRLITAKSMAMQGCEWMCTRLSDVDVPFLVVHAGADRVTNPEISKRFHAEAASKDKKIIIYDGAYHADMCHGGPTKKKLIQQFFADAGGWIAAHTG